MALTKEDYIFIKQLYCLKGVSMWRLVDVSSFCVVFMTELMMFYHSA